MELTAVELDMALVLDDEGAELPPPLPPPHAVNTNPMLTNASDNGSLVRRFIRSPDSYDY